MERSPAAAEPVTSPLMRVGSDSVIAAGTADVGTNRETLRRRRLWRLAMWVGVPTSFLWWRILDRRPFNIFQVPNIDWAIWIIPLVFVLMAVGYVLFVIFQRRSPHIVYRPDQIDVRMSDVIGIKAVKAEVIRSINLFLSHKSFANEMGGTPRRGLLFEGLPGTGKTYTAKAMAAESGVPFLYVSATSFQSMYYGATAGKIRSYFKALRKTALAEGGAIGFIEEIDAIGGTRNGMMATSLEQLSKSVQCCGSLESMPAGFLEVAPAAPVTNTAIAEGVGGVVNELLIQMQSFDEPMGMQKFWNATANGMNKFLPAHRQITGPKITRPNILLIAATNRADSLDPALIRPGRFDRTLTFDVPDRSGRRELGEYFLQKKAHHEELDDSDRQNALAAVTQGFTPVMIEQLFDEALVNAVRRGDNKMNWKDIEGARLVLQVGIGQPVGYTEFEKRLIATHEAGHATTAYLMAPTRRLEILSIIKRRDALGMLAHGDMEEVYTRSKTEMIGLIRIAMGGQCAEEIFFGDVSTGPAGDLLYATNVAAQMVGAAGMMDSLISYAAIQGSSFNNTNIVGRVLSDTDGRRSVEELLQEQKVTVRGALEANQHLVMALRDALLERDELVGHEITDVLDAAKAGGPAPAVIDIRTADEAARDALVKD
jgi:ATP-dependent Zn protease